MQRVTKDELKEWEENDISARNYLRTSHHYKKISRYYKGINNLSGAFCNLLKYSLIHPRIVWKVIINAINLIISFNNRCYRNDHVHSESDFLVSPSLKGSGSVRAFHPYKSQAEQDYRGDSKHAGCLPYMQRIRHFPLEEYTSIHSYEA